MFLHVAADGIVWYRRPCGSCGCLDTPRESLSWLLRQETERYTCFGCRENAELISGLLQRFSTVDGKTLWLANPHKTPAEDPLQLLERLSLPDFGCWRQQRRAPAGPREQRVYAFLSAVRQYGPDSSEAGQALERHPLWSCFAYFGGVRPQSVVRVLDEIVDARWFGVSPKKLRRFFGLTTCRSTAAARQRRSLLAQALGLIATSPGLSGGTDLLQRIAVQRSPDAAMRFFVRLLHACWQYNYAEFDEAEELALQFFESREDAIRFSRYCYRPGSGRV